MEVIRRLILAVSCSELLRAARDGVVLKVWVAQSEHPYTQNPFTELLPLVGADDAFTDPSCSELLTVCSMAQQMPGEYYVPRDG